MAYDLPDWTKGVDIIAQTIPVLRIDIVAQTIATLNVDIVAQSVGNIAIDIAAQSMGNVDIDVAAQTIDLDIKTSGGINIIIDLLEQDAYTEDRRILTNYGVAPSWSAAVSPNCRGKFYPRGARGFIVHVGVYCRDNAAAGGTITVYLSPYIGAGYIYSANVVVPPAGGEAWRNAIFNIMWNYDSLFIYLVCSNANTQFAYDADTPYDVHFSSDSGATWTYTTWRLWARVYMTAETCGDIPVSGIVNNIEIPSSSTGSEWINVPCAAGAETTLCTIYGMGTIERIGFYAAHDAPECRIYVDGVRLDDAWATGSLRLSPNGLNTGGYTANTPHIQLTRYNAGGDCNFAVEHKIQFRFSFSIRVWNWDAAAHNCGVGLLYNLLR